MIKVFLKRIFTTKHIYYFTEMPQKTLPVLDVDGKLLPQSMAIVRYLATSFGTYIRCLR